MEDVRHLVHCNLKRWHTSSRHGKNGRVLLRKSDGAYRESLTVSDPNKFKLNFFAILLVVAKYY